MRKIYLFLVLAFTSLTLLSQQVPRQMVVLEIGTGLWCQYCPGASMGASDLISNGHSVAVIKYHSGDSLANASSASRIGYYGMTGFPTSKFDGALTHVGGSNSVSLYPTFLPLYQQREAIPSSFLIDIAGTSSGNNYNIVLSLKKVAAYSGTNVVVHLALTQSNMPISWQGQSSVNQALRLMIPGALGTPLDFSSGDLQIVSLNFTRASHWVTNNLELVAFIQDVDTKEILQGNKVMLSNLPPPLQVDFSFSQNEFCAPQQVQFTDQSVGATNWKWNFPGGTPSSSTQQNPMVTYSTAGVYDVKLTAWNNDRGNIELKSGLMQVSAVPSTPVMPVGPSALCQSPPPSNFSVAPIASTNAYEWELSPASAGTLTPNMNQCVIDWDPDFLGSAQLKVRGINDCGNGNWSPIRNIAISQQPGQAGTPSGQTVLCQNPGATEYSSAGTDNVTDYFWELSPASAGTVIPMWTVCNIEWNPAFTGTALLTITGGNNGCLGEPSEALSIVVNSYPQDFAVTGGGVFCEGQTGIDVGLAGSENGVDYTLLLDGVSTGQTLPGTGSTIGFGLQDQEGVYTVKALNTATSCEVFMNGDVSVTMQFIPGIADQPDGPVSVYTPDTPTSEYTTTGALHATAYEWEFVPAEIGSTTAVGPQVTVAWSETFQGEVLIRVRGVNSCGEGIFSEDLVVMVDNGVGIGKHSLSSPGSIFPNPASGNVTIDPGFDGDFELRITDLTGKLIYSDRFSGIEPIQLNLEHLNAGVYLVTLISKQQTLSRRLIMQ